MNILVLGGAVYIVSHFVKNAIKHGHKLSSPTTCNRDTARRSILRRVFI